MDCVESRSKTGSEGTGEERRGNDKRWKSSDAFEMVGWGQMLRTLKVAYIP